MKIENFLMCGNIKSIETSFIKYFSFLVSRPLCFKANAEHFIRFKNFKKYNKRKDSFLPLWFQKNTVRALQVHRACRQCLVPHSSSSLFVVSILLEWWNGYGLFFWSHITKKTPYFFQEELRIKKKNPKTPLIIIYKEIRR